MLGMPLWEIARVWTMSNRKIYRIFMGFCKEIWDIYGRMDKCMLFSVAFLKIIKE